MRYRLLVIAFVALSIFLTVPLFNQSLIQARNNSLGRTSTESNKSQASNQTPKIKNDAETQKAGFSFIAKQEVGEFSRWTVHSESKPYPLLPSEDGDPLQMVLRLTQGVESNPMAKAAIQRAATKWEALISKALLIVEQRFSITVDIDFANSAFGKPFQTPGTIAMTNMTQAYRISDQIPFSAYWRDYYYSYEHQRAIQQEFRGTTFLTDLGNTSAFIWTRSIHLALDFGSIREFQHHVAFNSSLNYDFDPSDGIDPGKLDFESLVAREFGRLLGFVSRVGVKEIDT